MRKEDFPILQSSKGAMPLVYLDSAASSQVPLPVIEAMADYYKHSHANIHRGVYDLAQEATELYEQAHEAVRKFVNAKSIKEVIFTKNATESINLAAHCLSHQLKPGDEIVVTALEHHSNLVPWQMVAKKTGAVIKFILLDQKTKNLDLGAAKRLITKKTKIVAFTHVSNVLGVATPVKEIVAVAKSVNAITLLDACQSVPHRPVDVQELGVDLLAFSAHKLCGPTGIGVLYGKEELLNKLPPFMGGGDMIRTVTRESSTWNDLPWKFEAGTPNIVGAVGLKAAMDYLNSIGMKKIHDHEKKLTQYLHEQLSKIPNVVVYSPKESVGVVSFNLEGIHAHDVATILNDYNVAVRAGNHCAQPLMGDLGVSAAVRASVYFYNEKADVDALIAAIHKAKQVFRK